jgi:hypothetical protein
MTPPFLSGAPAHLNLYWDRGTIGVLDSEDILLATTATLSGGSAGNYLFDSLPDGYFLV